MGKACIAFDLSIFFIKIPFLGIKTRFLMIFRGKNPLYIMALK